MHKEAGAKLLIIDDRVVWTMTAQDERYLAELLDLVDLWHVRPDKKGGDGTFYLSKRYGLDGLCAAAHTFAFASIQRVKVRREYILAVDLERHTAQVVLDGKCAA